MMASPIAVAFGALVAAALWTVIGMGVSSRLFPDRSISLAAAPALGWAVCNAAALPVFLLIGFSFTAVTAVAMSAFIAATVALVSQRGVSRRPVTGSTGVPILALAGAALLALAPTVAILPKVGQHGVLLAAPIFDHSKIAVIDSITRLGLPVMNPVFEEAGGQAPPFAYYYLWHFSAAVISMLTGVSGWEADAAMTWFTAFASLTLMMGLAVRFGKRAAAAYWVLPLVVMGSLRPVLEALLGRERLDMLIEPPTGLAGWLFQATWSPQHLASASCLLLTMLLLERLTEQVNAVTGVVLVLVLVLAAGFESSIWIGGITTAFAAPAILLVLLMQREGRNGRLRLVIAAGACAILAALVASPFLIAQAQAAASRGIGLPLQLSPYKVLGSLFQNSPQWPLDLPAYWVVLLVVEFPAVYLTGVVVLVGGGAKRRLGALLAAILAVSLTVGWLLVSTVGDNNDLGWRAVLPAVMVLAILSAAGLARWVARPAVAASGASILLAALGLPDAVGVVRGNVAGNLSATSKALFADTPALWEAVRRHSGPADRVANNPLFLRDMVPWPVNISWALLADRLSCYAGKELAIAFAPLPPHRREEIELEFVRVFSGDGKLADMDNMISRYGCRVAVVTVQDGAWASDPFADSSRWSLAETRAGQWRIYVTSGGTLVSNPDP